jgi:hypothetical protein
MKENLTKKYNLNGKVRKNGLIGKFDGYVRDDINKEVELEDLWDWICSEIGFDQKGKEIQQAIKRYIKKYDTKKN